MARAHQDFMNIALRDARADAQRGGRPVAALVVREGEIIGRGLNTVRADMNPNAHAEVNAIRDACSKLDTAEFHAINVPGATLYTTLEPCPMCLATAIFAAKIGCVVIGARHARVGRKDLGEYSIESYLAFTGHTDVTIVTGVLEAECENLRLEWLRSLAPDDQQRETLRSLTAASR